MGWQSERRLRALPRKGACTAASQPALPKHCCPPPGLSASPCSPIHTPKQGGGKITYNVIKTRLGDLLYKLRCAPFTAH